MYNDRSIRITDIAQHFDCRNVGIMCYQNEIDTLVQKRYIRVKKSDKYQKVYCVPTEVAETIKKGIAYSAPSLTGLTIQEYFDELYRLFDFREDKEIDFSELCSKLFELTENNHHLQICKKILDSHLLIDRKDRALLLFFCHKYVHDDDDSLGSWDMEDLYDSKSDFSKVRNNLKSNTHALQEEKLIETWKGADFLSRDTYRLTDSAKESLLVELNLQIKKMVKPKNIIECKDIKEKPLYYNTTEQEQIDQLTSLLKAENFSKVQKKLVKNGMRKGFACLFHGAPGTGKTETAYQIARQTGRDIMYVNVSEIKSMWVGESEKNIKELFNHYRNFSTQVQNTPILLFNEADAVIGIRQEGAQRAVDKMENSIQNIILQEMENLDGIMIATTNLTQNLDKAFERRFLYKIEYGKPNAKAKEKIWEAMLPGLTKTNRKKLSEEYDFSGGQIENIARKYTVDSILHRKKPSIDTIVNYCNNESLYKKEERRRIGF
jgi:SpoVK/Ycf46/Vps4 family AAA+-type ATPase